MINVLYAYATGSLVTIFWISYIRYFMLDPDDRKYSTDDIHITYLMYFLFWPLLLIKPRLFLQGRDLFKVDKISISGILNHQENRLEELVQIVKNPPLCGQVVLYRYIYDEQNKPTDIFFKSSEIESHFKGKELPLYHYEEKQAIVAWIKNRDESHEEPTPIPEQINFARMAIDLVNNGYGEITCAECNKRYPARLITQQRSKLHAGWNTEYYLCPNGHKTFMNDWIHVNMKQQ